MTKKKKKKEKKISHSFLPEAKRTFKTIWKSIVPIVVQQKQTQPVSMRMQVPSLASLSGLRI